LLATNINKSDNKIYYIDLLFFNVNLNCQVVIEPKMQEAKSKDIVQVKFYSSLVDRNIKLKNHNKAITY